MTKKNHTPFGQLFSPELKEITRRLKRKEPELDQIVQRGSEPRVPADLSSPCVSGDITQGADQEEGVDYQKYLNSPQWALKREERLRLDHGRCAACGTRENLRCHHTNYDNLGNEDVEDDLLTLCESCHDATHEDGQG